MARLAAELRAGLTVAADRNRIALEMHDGVQGQLMTIAAQLELARCVAPQDGPRAARLAAALRAADDPATVQLLLAKATGHFKHGTER
jgi:signal transduction histidine kinase